ncbi:MAG TPA: DUF3987 domain-containing protein, partial [Prosthecobacter sp.]|nr:DUF3987 domain-containing protein [Prosthecobacter sp.]
KLAPLVEGALRESIQDDGWLQRLSLLVWPDAPADFELIDRLPDSPALAEVQRLFDRAEATAGADWPGAVLDDDHAAHAYLRLAPEAAGLFRDWLQQETTALRRAELPAALESHFMKYRKTVCALALLFHLAGDPDEPAVPLIALLRALDWIEYLKAHAQRVYGAHKNNTAETAGRVLAKIKSGELPGRFKAREIKQHRWEGLTESAAVDAALGMLVEYGWVREVELATPGRYTTEYVAYPDVVKAE